MLYNLYAGLTGVFGGCRYRTTEEFDTEQEAEDAARILAVQEYEEHAGLYELPSWDDICDKYCEENQLDEANLSAQDNEEIDQIYEETMDSWLSYLVTTIDEDPHYSMARLLK